MTAEKFYGTLEGRLESRRIGRHSKSEKIAYYIVFDADHPVEIDRVRPTELRIELEGENPFEQPTLKSLVGNRVRASDGYRIGGLWRAARVEEVVPPRKRPRKKRSRKR
ncbi:MAG TPA: hypothetical protein VL283_04160 [Candidatus Baltobacteraceae bacterium]|jgi:hypothetical protein|nr:hypothetical protein [Candidatus Baltobacteraceae bacterium]